MAEVTLQCEFKPGDLVVCKPGLETEYEMDRYPPPATYRVLGVVAEDNGAGFVISYHVRAASANQGLADNVTVARQDELMAYEAFQAARKMLQQEMLAAKEPAVTNAAMPLMHAGNGGYNPPKMSMGGLIAKKR